MPNLNYVSAVVFFIFQMTLTENSRCSVDTKQKSLIKCYISGCQREKSVSLFLFVIAIGTHQNMLWNSQKFLCAACQSCSAWQLAPEKKTEQEIFSLAEKMQSSVKREARKKETYNDIIKNINFKSISIRFVYSCTRCVLFSSRSFLSLSIACAVVIVVPSFCFASIVTLARPCNLSFFIFHFGKEECLFTLRWDERKRDHTSGELNHIHTEIRWKQEQKQKIDATAGHTTKFIYQSNTCNFGVV